MFDKLTAHHDLIIISLIDWQSQQVKQAIQQRSTEHFTCRDESSAMPLKYLLLGLHHACTQLHELNSASALLHA